MDSRLAESLPLELVKLGILKWLGRGSGQPAGSLPPQLGKLSNLKCLDGKPISLPRPCCRSLGSPAAWEGLISHSNQLSGWRLGLTCNQLIGSLPPELEKLNS